MAPLWTAVRLLTPLPIPWAGKPKPSDMGEAVAYFPMAGLLVGLVVLAACCLAGLDHNLMHSSLWSVVILALWAWFGSSLHLEGLADTLHGLASGQKGPQMLRVLREPGLTALGAAGVFLALLAKFMWLESMTANLFWVLPFPMIISRCGQGLACGFGRYAGSNQGAGRDYVRNATSTQSFVGLGWGFTFMALAGLLAWWRMGVQLSQIAFALLAAVLGLAIGMLCLWLAMRRLKGASGHLLGFGSEICEISTAFLLVFLLAK
jgi:cobalamin synthase